MDFWLQRALHEIDSSTDGIPPELMSIPPAPGKWSIAQILEHLSITYRQTVGALAKVVQGGLPTAGKRSFKQWLFTRVVADLGYFPTGRPAPPATVPADPPPAQVLREIHENLVAMDGILKEVEQKFGPGVQVANHPVLGPFTVQEWRKFHFRHAHHHLKQVNAMRQRMDAGAKRASA